MQQRQLHVDDRWFNAIANGTKTFEGRLCTRKYAQLRIGDKIQFINSGKIINATVVSLNNYSDFARMLHECTIEKVLPGVSDIPDGLEIYHKYYQPDNIVKYGVVAIGIAVE